MMLQTHIYGVVVVFQQKKRRFSFHIESESKTFVSLFPSLPEISKFMALEVPEDYNYSLGLQEGVMDLFDFI